MTNRALKPGEIAKHIGSTIALHKLEIVAIVADGAGKPILVSR
jgi:hypothetical protein